MKPRLDINHLDMLLAISQQERLADAAKVLHITPSALTHRVQEAERRLGVNLFEKIGRSLRPTAAAQILTLTAERILFDLKQSENVAIASSEGIQHVIRLAVAVYNAFHWLPPFLAWFHEQHPTISVEIVTHGAQTPYDQLVSNQIDVIISPDNVLPRSLEATRLFSDELVAVVPKGHPLGGKSFATGEDFSQEKYLTYSLVRQPGFEADRIWAKEDIMPMQEETIGSIEAICELVKAGFGISILSHWAIYPQFETGALIPVRMTSGGLEIAWQAILKGNVAKTAPQRQLVNRLQDWFELNTPMGLSDGHTL